MNIELDLQVIEQETRLYESLTACKEAALLVEKGSSNISSGTNRFTNLLNSFTSDMKTVSSPTPQSILVDKGVEILQNLDALHANYHSKHRELIQDSGLITLVDKLSAKFRTRKQEFDSFIKKQKESERKDKRKGKSNKKKRGRIVVPLTLPYFDGQDEVLVAGTNYLKFLRRSSLILKDVVSEIILSAVQITDNELDINSLSQSDDTTILPTQPSISVDYKENFTILSDLLKSIEFQVNLDYIEKKYTTDYGKIHGNHSDILVNSRECDALEIKSLVHTDNESMKDITEFQDTGVNDSAYFSYENIDESTKNLKPNDNFTISNKIIDMNSLKDSKLHVRQLSETPTLVNDMQDISSVPFSVSLLAKTIEDQALPNSLINVELQLTNQNKTTQDVHFPFVFLKRSESNADQDLKTKLFWDIIRKEETHGLVLRKVTFQSHDNISYTVLPVHNSLDPRPAKPIKSIFERMFSNLTSKKLIKPPEYDVFMIPTVKLVKEEEDSFSTKALTSVHKFSIQKDTQETKIGFFARTFEYLVQRFPFLSKNENDYISLNEST